MLIAVGKKRKILNEDGVENTLGNTNDSCILFVLHEESKAASLSLLRRKSSVSYFFPHTFACLSRINLARQFWVSMR